MPETTVPELKRVRRFPSSLSGDEKDCFVLDGQRAGAIVCSIGSDERVYMHIIEDEDTARACVDYLRKDGRSYGSEDEALRWRANPLLGERQEVALCTQGARETQSDLGDSATCVPFAVLRRRAAGRSDERPLPA